MIEKISRAEINELPLMRYEGPIHLVRERDALETALGRLQEEGVLGFDTETKPAFRKGTQYRPSLLQLAGADSVYIFQLDHIGMAAGLCRLMTRKGIVKAGVGIHQDLSELRRLRDFSPGNCVDLAALARQARIRNLGLRGLAAALLGFRISKGAQTSNWGRDRLTPQQLTYAATDAWVGREIYLRLNRDYPHLFSSQAGAGRKPKQRDKAVDPAGGPG